ncbi:uncharacterized protein LOC111488189 [Cucurbita maxima]|uniref:Uncharacterized protein LOC111488189 n=1 Tax=Cucurbita maxima TaxID=3661 RepID=A0A6J1JVD5_CUCMA|nr:uncharacterized protein LOC111488189 [Cucurbita maxima]XP_022991629.1 uncharacterized protein LOC111488189 [Cucurbita maxima]XP_022991630.1 uncharacterized protein LOC111488189 [Cucurbita maxima]
MENQKRQPPRETIAEEEEEEVEMEKFYALVRNFKEIRDRWRKEVVNGEGDETAAEKTRKRMKTTETVQNQSSWILRFEREDFDEDLQVGGAAVELPKHCCLVKEDTPVAAAPLKKEKKVASGVDCLDLNLSL